MQRAIAVLNRKPMVRILEKATRGAREVIMGTVKIIAATMAVETAKRNSIKSTKMEISEIEKSKSHITVEIIEYVPNSVVIKSGYE